MNCQPSINYFVTDQNGRFIMTCPLGVLGRVFSLTKKQLEMVERETLKLDAECKVSIGHAHMEFKVEWSPIIVRRLPIEIPRQAE